jgi:hypothetical protein
MYTREIFPAQQTLYALSAASFAQQFLTALTQEYATLSHALRDQPEARGILDVLKMRLVKDTYSEGRIAAAVMDHHDLVLMLYQHFTALLGGRDEDMLFRRRVLSLHDRIGRIFHLRAAELSRPEWCRTKHAGENDHCAQTS